ncbi:polysaccharide biosynthesis/export family protein [Burkholderia cenocepacia]
MSANEAQRDYSQHIRVVDLASSDGLASLTRRSVPEFSREFGGKVNSAFTIGRGDSVEVTIWEAAPAALFGSISGVSPTGGAAGSVTTLPDQVVDSNGCITVPFVGAVVAAGKTIAQLEVAIGRALTGKANRPQVVVRMARNSSSYVTVIGDVKSALRMPLTPSGERLLDALAAAGGAAQPVEKSTVQITRGTMVHGMPLSVVVRDPRQNIPLQPGDVVTVSYQPLSFTVLGATGKNDEISFETQGITLAQALARSGGLQDHQSDAKGVFVFRFESAVANDTPAADKPGRMALAPVVFRLDLRNPESLFIAQQFEMRDRDVLYVSDAPATEVQKFLNLIFTAVYPVANTVRAFQ